MLGVKRRDCHLSVFASGALALLLGLAASGCGGHGSASSGLDASASLLPSHQVTPAVFSSPDALHPPLLPGELPALPQGDGVPASRSASYVQVLFNKGSGIWDQSTGNVSGVEDLTMIAGPGKLEWAEYEFSTGGYQPEKYSAGLSCTPGSIAWVAVSNYGRGAWQFFGPYSSDAVINIGSGNYINSSGQSFMLVLTYDASTVSVNYTTYSLDNAASADFSVEGTVSESGVGPLPGVQVIGGVGINAQTDKDGHYLLVFPAAGMYDISANGAADQVDFSNPTQNVDVQGHMTGIDFSGDRQDLFGRVLNSDGDPLPGVQVTLSPGFATTHTNANGYYRFVHVTPSTADTVTPLLPGYSFTPATANLNSGTADQQVPDFSGAGGAPTFKLNGTILDTSNMPLPDAFVTLTPGFKQVITGADGSYSFSGLPAADYTVTPIKGFYTFTPASRHVTVDASSVNGVDFSATPPPPTFTMSATAKDFNFSNLPVPYIDVVLLDHAHADKLLFYGETDGDGNVSFPPQPAGDYDVQIAQIGYVVLGSGIMLTNSDQHVDVDAVLIGNKPTYGNFIGPYLGQWCLQCHRSDSQTAQTPFLTTYNEAKNAAGTSNSDIKNSIMPPGGVNANLPIYKAYWQAWIDNGEPEN